MSEQSSTPSDPTEQPKPQPQSAEWQGTAAPVGSGELFTESVDRQLVEDFEAAMRSGGGKGDGGAEQAKDVPPALQEDETQIAKPENS